jgi:hypothetical protein
MRTHALATVVAGEAVRNFCLLITLRTGWLNTVPSHASVNIRPV